MYYKFLQWSTRKQHISGVIKPVSRIWAFLITWLGLGGEDISGHWWAAQAPSFTTRLESDSQAFQRFAWLYWQILVQTLCLLLIRFCGIESQIGLSRASVDPSGTGMIVLGTASLTGDVHCVGLASTDRMDEGRRRKKSIFSSIFEVSEVLIHSCLNYIQFTITIAIIQTQHIRDIHWITADNVLCAAGSNVIVLNLSPEYQFTKGICHDGLWQPCNALRSFRFSRLFWINSHSALLDSFWRDSRDGYEPIESAYLCCWR